MFSGIIENMARVVAIEHEQDNVHLTLSCPFADELSIDQSVAHNGVCLTVVLAVISWFLSVQFGHLFEIISYNFVLLKKAVIASLM